MRLISLLIISFLLVSCAVKLNTDPIQVQGNITHTITVDPIQLESFYKAYCATKFTDQTDIDQCVTESLAQFWNAVNQSLNQGV